MTQGNLLYSTTKFDQMALWRVPVSGVNISAPVQVFEIASLGGTVHNPHYYGATEPTGWKHGDIWLKPVEE